MENVFSSIATRYYEKGLIVTPIKYGEKRPVLENWTDKNLYTDYDKIIDKFKSSNIGLLLGEPSGVIAIDIDKEEAMHLVPPSPVRKKGAKGETRFFKYSGELNAKNLKLGIELLSTGNQTVLPPSLHPSKINYAWITPDTLLDLNTNDLPTLSKDFINKFLTWGASESTGGRHNTLIKIMGGKVSDRKTSDQCIKETMEYDIQNHEVPYFTDKSETHGGSGYLAALKMYQSVVSTATRRGDFIDPMETQEATFVDEKKEDKTKQERMQLPHLLGIGQELFKIAYDNSHVARSHFTFPAILSIASIIMGNKISFQGVHPNIYCLLAGGSGSGKSSAMDFIKMFLQHFGLAEKLLGDGSPSGDTALIQNLPTQRERIDVIDEGDSLFLTINSINSYGKKLADTYASLFTSPGKVFLGKNSSAYRGKGNETGNVGGCFSPFVTMILGMTFKAFEQSVSEHTIEKGFGARILYFADNEKKRNKKSIPMKIPQNISDTVKMWMSVGKVDIDKEIYLAQNPFMKEFRVREAKINQENQKILDAYMEEIAEMNFKEPEDSKVISILSRSGEYFKKIAIICAFFTQPHTTHLEITKECLDWAREFIIVHLHNSRIFIEGHINQGQYNDKVNKIHAYIKNREGVSKQSVSNNFQKIPKKERKEIIQDLIEMGKIKEVDKLLYSV